MTWVTRARVIPSRRAISTWFADPPDSKGLPLDRLAKELDDSGQFRT